VDSGAGVFSSGICAGDFAAALTTGDAFADLEASLELLELQLATEANAAAAMQVAIPKRVQK
jgi:hypothetical protein